MNLLINQTLCQSPGKGLLYLGIIDLSSPFKAQELLIPVLEFRKRVLTSPASNLIDIRIEYLLSMIS